VTNGDITISGADRTIEHRTSTVEHDAPMRGSDRMTMR